MSSSPTSVSRSSTPARGSPAPGRAAITRRSAVGVVRNPGGPWRIVAQTLPS
jgi:hypothetical protein